MHKTKRALMEVLIASLILGSNPIWISLISLPAESIVFWRTIFALISLGVFMQLSGQGFKLKSRKDFWSVVLVGFLFSLHWLSFFYAIKVSTVAVAMIATFTLPVITTFLEPLFDNEKLDKVDLLLALLVLIGVVVIAPDFSLDNDITLGLVLGLASAFFYALRNILTRRHVQNYSSSLLFFYQLLVTAIVLLPFMFNAESLNFAPYDLVYLFVLGVVGASFGHTLFVKSMQHLKARAVGVITSVQPVYGILLAYLILDQTPSFKEVMGGMIILFGVLIEASRHSHKDELVD